MRPLSESVLERERERGETERWGERDGDRVLERGEAETGERVRTRPRERLREAIVQVVWVLRLTVFGIRARGHGRFEP